MSESRWLYRCETRGIQRYVLGTQKLREIAGASALVKSIAEAIRERVGTTGTVVFAAAGNAEVIFENREALERFASVWPLVVSRVAPGLEVSQGWAEITGDDMDAARTRLFAALRADRARPQPSLPEAGPFIARSGRTGRPAVFERDRWITRDGSVDATTRAKLRAAREIAGALERELCPPGYTFAAEDGELGSGYVAVVHADGNDMGALFAQHGGSPEQLAALSRTLGEVTAEAARAGVQAVAERLKSSGAAGTALPIRPVLLGGDDLTLLVAAPHAMAFTEAFLRAFEKESEERLGPITGAGLTAAAGIAIVKPGFPFYRAYELSEALCGEAKRRCRRADAPTPSALMFHRVTDATTTDWSTIEREALVVDLGGNRSGTLVGGPWTLERLERLRELAIVLGELPRGSVREWLDLVRRDPERVAAHVERVREVLDPEVRERLDAALEALDVDPHTLFERATGKAPVRSPILDALTWRVLDPSLSVTEQEAAACSA